MQDKPLALGKLKVETAEHQLVFIRQYLLCPIVLWCLFFELVEGI
jgi:hypothetical protein